MKNRRLFSLSIVITIALLALHFGSASLHASETLEPLRLIDTERHQGPFTVGGRDFFVVLQSKCLSGTVGHHSEETLVGLKVLDAGGYVVRQETFPYEVVDGRFARTLSASAAMFAGAGGSALAIEFFEVRADQPLKQSWMLFGVINNRLQSFNSPMAVGQSAVGGVVSAVMVQGGIEVVPMASRAELVELPVWVGGFYAGVPIRMNWAQVQWSQGAQCFANGDGRLHEDGCNMHVEADVQPTETLSAVLLSPEPRQNAYTVRYTPVRSNSKIEVLGTRGIVSWQEVEGRVECHLSDVWLRVRINDAEGWVSGEEAFAALGLAANHTQE